MTTAEDGERFVAAAHALRPRILACRDEIESGRRLPPPLVHAMKGARVFSLSMPRDWGGPELDPMTQVRVVEALSMADGSVGWAAMLGLHAGYFAAFLDPAAAREMYADLDAFTGGVTRPTGKAVAVPGGYRVSGRWAFGSCCEHSAWLFSSCVVIEDGAPRKTADGGVETRLCYLPGDAIQVIDTWTTTGLRGTGSHDYAIEDFFVPAERTFDPMRAPIRRNEPLYGLRNMYLVNLSGIPLGIARAAIDSVVELAEGKLTRIGTGLKDEAHVQAAVARAEALLGSARGFVFDVVEDIWAGLVAGKPASARQHALFRLSVCNAYDLCVEAVDLMFKAASGTALYASSPLDRHFRDIHTASQHFVVSAKITEAAGRVLLGLKPGVPSF
jgi:alkylation response protein AidB-like acyl-CoA dehydrogenase